MANPSPRKPVYRFYPSTYSSPSFLFYNKNLSTWRSMIVIFHIPQRPFLVYMITCFLQQQEQEQQQHCLPETKKQIIKTNYQNLSSRLRWIPNLWHSMTAVLLRFLSMELLCDTLPTQSLTSSQSQTQLRTACKQPHMLLYTTASASPPLRPNIGILLPHHPFLTMFSCN